MPKVAVFNIKGDQVGEIDLNDQVFGVEVNESVLHDAVVMQLASLRRGSAETKTRAEVRGGGRKPWRQKGTGRARAGTIRSPLWRGGGIVFGPHARSYSYSLPRKVRRLALKSALSSKVASGNIIVVEDLSLDTPKTKEMVEILGNLNAGKALVVTGEVNDNAIKSARNIPGVKPVAAQGINVYDLVKFEKLVITRDAVAKVEEVLA